MPISDLVKEWDESGKLENEFQQLSAILAEQQYTREQVMVCFDTLVTPLCLMLASVLGRQPTLEEFKEKNRHFFSDRKKLMELCMFAVYCSEQPEREVLTDLLREIENQQWQQEDEQ